MSKDSGCNLSRTTILHGRDRTIGRQHCSSFVVGWPNRLTDAVTGIVSELFSLQEYKRENLCQTNRSLGIQ